MSNRLTALRRLRTSLSQQVQFLENDQRILIELGFARTALKAAMDQVETVMVLIEIAIREEAETKETENE